MKKHLIGYGSYGSSSDCVGMGISHGSGCASNGIGATSEKIAGLTPFAWVMVALATGTLAYLVGQREGRD
jgi:hypothetical protein